MSNWYSYVVLCLKNNFTWKFKELQWQMFQPHVLLLLVYPYFRIIFHLKYKLAFRISHYLELHLLINLQYSPKSFNILIRSVILQASLYNFNYFFALRSAESYSKYRYIGNKLSSAIHTNFDRSAGKSLKKGHPQKGKRYQ